MMICDGVLPSNEGRGYVLRRILRRAARHGRLLGLTGVFLCDVCGTVIEENKCAYPDLVEKAGYIARVIRIEEENFGKTIDAGTTILTGLIAAYKGKGKDILSGADAFKLYDTYGFPLDLTVDILKENGMDVEIESFNEQMEEQRARARKAREALGDLAWAGIDLGLDNSPTAFSGYDNISATGSVLAIVTQGEISSSIRACDSGIIVLDKTPFYAEMGGQASDFGTISCGGAVFEVSGVQQNKGGKYLHHGIMRSGVLNVDDTVTAEIDIQRRRSIMRAHSATHLLHEALRAVLGEHVRQAGSLVEPDRLRFDFTHIEALTKEELMEVQRRVNNAILDGLPVTADEMPLEEAKRLGATALFGEKYGETVRVIRMGGDYSIELCGGTHLDNTAKTGAFLINAEFSIAAGIRRVEAITGTATLDALDTARSHLSVLSGMLKAGAPEELAGKVENNIQALREMRSKLDAAAAKAAGSDAERLINDSKDIDGIKVIASIIENADADKLRQLADSLRDYEPNIVAALASSAAEKITIVIACGKAAVEKGVKAGDLIREVTKICGGSGGGKADFAMGGGKDAEKLNEALDAVYGFIEAKGNIKAYLKPM